MKTIVGLFDHMRDAQAAVDELLQAGVRREHISVVTPRQEGNAATTVDEGTTAGEGAAAGAGAGAVLGGTAGLIASLAGLAIPGVGPILAAGPIVATLVGAGAGAVAGGLIGGLIAAGVPEEEARVYQEGVRRGKTLVTVATADEKADEVSLILNRRGALDVDREAARWRSDAGETGATAASADTVRAGDERELRVPVVEEELQVGKRPAERGGVRVYSHVSERPVQEQVKLREEHVHVERRPADRPASEEDLHEDQTLELTETTEEAVVQKRPRVVEEVVVRKDVEEHTETVQDTVRRKDVEVEQINSAGGGDRGGSGASFQSLDTEFRRNYESTFARQGYTYEQCRPAYEYGYESRQRYGDREWSNAEAEIRTDWEREHPGTWEQFKEGIRHAFARSRD